MTTAQASAVKWVAALTGLSSAQAEEYARTHHRLNVHDLLVAMRLRASYSKSGVLVEVTQQRHLVAAQDR
ncbi:hypothetical protein [Rhodococcoides fascians]|uniref:hypothetical protein n=1 Tax=Rhodococcoides fascians TaxID=1828 RepID=UPI001E29B52D|nr:hypothetical protein [Rhodococcus fascians]